MVLQPSEPLGGDRGPCLRRGCNPHMRLFTTSARQSELTPSALALTVALGVGQNCKCGHRPQGML